MSGGKRFAGDFQRIDAVKPNDKMLIQDSADGNVKFAFPAQITTINGWKTVESVEELPLNPVRKDIAYVVGDNMYFWVGTGGDTLGGVYQKANIFKGGDGETPHIHFAYANSADGYNDFSMTESANRAYMGIYADYAEEGSTDPTRYTWVRIQGAQGTPSYVHVAYAESADGSVGFSLTDSLNKPYLGIYVDSTKGALDDPAVYKWTLIKGSQGLASYVHIAYANSADGVQDFSTTTATGRSYLGTYASTDPQASTNPSDYAWMLTKGERGEQGEQGEAGEGGAGGGMTVVEVEPTQMLQLENNTMYIFTEPTGGGLMLSLAESAQTAGSKCCVEFITNDTMIILPPNGVVVADTSTLKFDEDYKVQIWINNGILTTVKTPYYEFTIDADYGSGYNLLINQQYVMLGLIEGMSINGGDLIPPQYEYTFTEEHNHVSFKFRPDFPFELFGFSEMFNNSSAKAVDITNQVMKFVKTTHNMFFGCSNLESVSILGVDLYEVLEDTSQMFAYCGALQTINVNGWWTGRVKNMSRMFEQSGITSIDLSSWDVSNVEDMSSMFKNCDNLTSLDLSSWDVSKVRDMTVMFAGCSRLTNLNLGISWLNPNVSTIMMFDDVTTTGTFVYNPAFDYSKIINVLPATWTAQPRVINNQ